MADFTLGRQAEAVNLIEESSSQAPVPGHELQRSSNDRAFPAL